MSNPVFAFIIASTYYQLFIPAANVFDSNPGRLVAIAAGYWHSLALKSDGSIVAWGANYDSQATPQDGNDFVAIAAGVDISLAVRKPRRDIIAACFAVNHLKIAIGSERKGKSKAKGSDLDIKATFKPAVPVDLTVDDVAFVIDDGNGYVLDFFISAGSFQVEGKPEHQKFKYDSPKKAKPEIKARFDFAKCKFDLKAKRISSDEINGTTLGIALYVGNSLGEEVLKVQTRKKHLEYVRKPKLD